jgi:chloramphenicol 3-O phosphotransferase
MIGPTSRPYRCPMNVRTGKLIILNGGSSAGKTSIAREFQELAPESWLHLGIDAFWGALPLSQFDLQQVRPEYYSTDVTVEADGLDWLSLTPGPLLNAAMRARYLAIRAFLDQGINVIADDLIWTQGWLVDLLETLGGYDVWMVGLHVSDAEGSRRERQRGGRVDGANRGSARATHALVEYDVEIDTTDVAVPVLAQQLLDTYRACPAPAAFDRLRKRIL